MPKDVCIRLDNIERELQLLLLMQTASSRMTTRHSCDSSDSNDVIYCTPNACPANAMKSDHEIAPSNELNECPCSPPGDDQRHDFLKENVFVSVKTAKRQSRAASAGRKKTKVSCDIRRGGRYEQPERPCQDNCQGVCHTDEPRQDESCHPQCEADCTNMAAERDVPGGADRGSKDSALEERCRLLEQKNADLRALLETNHAQVRESIQSKELALAMARQLKERNDALRAEKERMERGGQVALTASLETVTGASTTATTEATPETPEATPETPEATPETPEATPESPEATPESPEATPETPEATPESPDATSESPDAIPEIPDTTSVDTAGETRTVVEDDVGVIEGVIVEDASDAADAIPISDEQRVRLAEARVDELELQWRAAEDQVRAAEERARLAEARLDDMDNTCDCHDEEGVEGKRREESAEFFDAEEQPKSLDKDTDESPSTSSQLKSTSKESDRATCKPGSQELNSRSGSQKLRSTSKDLDDRKSSKSTSKDRQADKLASFTAVLEEAVSQSERLKSLSQELLVAKSDSQKAKLVSATLVNLETRSKELEQEVAELKKENSQLFRAASETAQECCSCTEEVVRLRSTTADLDRVLSSQQERIGELQEINDMQEKLVLVQQQQMNSKEEQVRIANQEVEVVLRKSNELDEQVKRLRTSIESFERVQTAGEEREGQALQNARAKIGELTAEVESLRMTVDDYKKQLDGYKSARSQSGPVVKESMSDESCHCNELDHCPCLDDDDESGGVANPCSVEGGVSVKADADTDFQKFQRDALQAKQEVELIRKRSSELGGVALERSVRSIERLQADLQNEKRRSAEKIEAVASHYRASLEKEQDKVLIKDKIVEDQAATILQLKDLQKRLERDLQDSNQRAAQLLMQLKEAQRREKELTERLRQVEESAEEAPPVCTCDPCHEQLDAQDEALQQLEVQVAVKQREWDHKMRAVQKEKAAAIAAARFATVKLVEATNEFRRQLCQHREVQQMLASVMAEHQAGQKNSLSECICTDDEDMPRPPREGALGANASWTSRRRLVYQRQVTAQSPPR